MITARFYQKSSNGSIHIRSCCNDLAGHNIGYRRSFRISARCQASCHDIPVRYQAAEAAVISADRQDPYIIMCQHSGSH